MIPDNWYIELSYTKKMVLKTFVLYFVGVVESKYVEILKGLTIGSGEIIACSFTLLFNMHT